MKTILILVSAIFLIAASCNDKKNTTIQPLSAASFAGTYKLVEPGSKFEISLVLTSDSTSGEVTNRVAYKIAGRSSVNHYFGTLIGSSASDDVQISAIGSTKMAGPADAMQFETEYFKKLQAVKRYEATGNRLRFFPGSSDADALVYEKQK
ncbi:META domain-containing protein [Larkinella insperata]|uniref:META domain-containing protein n=1 Tax=Larkinella insperata TaxID=332158 RepID=A0ABW3QCS6_9BACT|nr:META domain-containing protein [Larkinella insperata]